MVRLLDLGFLIDCLSSIMLPELQAKSLVVICTKVQDWVHYQLISMPLHCSNTT